MTASIIAVAPLATLFLAAQTSLRHEDGWNSALGTKVIGVPLGFIIIGIGPIIALALLLGNESVRVYVKARALGLAILVVGLLALWGDNPLFDVSGVDALEQGGFDLWGRLFLSLIAIAAFRRLTRESPSRTGGSA